MKLSLLIVVVMLTGCASIYGALPSVKYCQKVDYQRDGGNVKINAECTV
jgi:hypothetical protein